jgi:DNA invertase Pin-like site-specific DNA recombinase
MKYGYCRVSTAGQLSYGASMEVQEGAVKEAGAEVVYKDVYTGTKTDRPKFNELLSVLSEGDTLIITKLDRFARSTSEAIETVNKLFKQGVKVHVLNMGLVEDTPTGRLIFNILSSFAEFERDMIVERTQEGKAIAKQKEGFKEGRPNKFSPKKIQHALTLLETNSYKQVEDVTGISKSTLIRHKKKMQKELVKK